MSIKLGVILLVAFSAPNFFRLLGEREGGREEGGGGVLRKE